MEVAGHESGSTLDLKHLFEIIQPAQYPKQTAKVDKLADDSLPDFNLAYLGPLIWNDTVMSDDLNSESFDLDDLLGDQSDAKELSDISSLLPTDETLKDEHTEKALRTAGSSNGGRQALAFPNPSFDQFCTPVQGYGVPALPPIPQPPNNVTSQDQAPGDGQKNFVYEPDITDVIISTPLDNEQANVELFDPTKRVFTSEELKPQPIVRKAKKVYVSKDSKDAKYWQKREKNNVAAKRSREARRIKENQIVMRTQFLESENKNLHDQVKDLNVELKRLMKVVEGYQMREAS